MNSNKKFDLNHALQELKHYLPTQTPLKDFIHHNTLHGFQGKKFYDAIFSASKIFGFQVTLRLSEFRALFKNGRIKNEILDRCIIEKKGKENLLKWKQNLLNTEYDSANRHRIGSLRSQWKKDYKIDLDNLVHPHLFRIICSYLDQGISVWKFPDSKKGFLDSIRTIEKNSFTSFFKTKRAKNILLNGTGQIEDLLKIIVGEESFFEQYLFDQQFAHHGWSGIVSSIEDQPQSLLDSKIISLQEFIVFELLLEIDSLDFELGSKWKPLCLQSNDIPLNLFEDIVPTELNEVLTLWQDAFEWSYYDEVLGGISQKILTPPSEPIDPSFDAIFCIDERECSIRRHLENLDKNCKTFGTPGFFGVEFYFQPHNGKFYDKLCPAPVTPQYLIKEYDVQSVRKNELLYSKKTHSFFQGTFIAFSLGILSIFQLFLNIFRPKMSPAISNSFTLMDPHSKLIIENKNIDDRENNLQIGFTVKEMTIRVESLLKNIGLTQQFSPIIYIIGVTQQD